MVKKSFKIFLLLVFIWLGYLFVSIINYPSGKMSDSADAAIVLGAAVYASKPSPVFKERLNHAINLYHSNKVGSLIFTGGTTDTNTPAESIVAREYALRNNVKADDIFIEAESVTTKQNLLNALLIIKQENFSSILIISDPLHLKRAMMMAKDLNINAKPSATPSSRYQSLKTKLPFALRELYFYHHYLLFSE